MYIYIYVYLYIYIYVYIYIKSYGDSIWIFIYEWEFNGINVCFIFSPGAIAETVISSKCDHRHRVCCRRVETKSML